MNTDKVTIEPLEDGRFLMENSRGAMFNCQDADDIGAYLETAMWNLLEPALKGKKKVTIRVEIDK